VKTKLTLEPQVVSANLDVVTEDSVVYLMGKINRTSGELAVDIARNTGGVRKVRAVFDYID